MKKFLYYNSLGSNVSRILGLIAIASFLFASCITPPDYPVEPTISFHSWNRDTMLQGFNDEDFVLATLEFTDGDGDIGNEDGEVTLFVLDLRDSTFNNSADKLPVVPEPGASNGISGDITFKIFQTCCLPPPEIFTFSCAPAPLYPIDTVLFEVWIKDRAGNESNHVIVDPIYLLCQ